MIIGRARNQKVKKKKKNTSQKIGDPHKKKKKWVYHFGNGDIFTWGVGLGKPTKNKSQQSMRERERDGQRGEGSSNHRSNSVCRSGPEMPWKPVICAPDSRLVNVGLENRFAPSNICHSRRDDPSTAGSKI